VIGPRAAGRRRAGAAARRTGAAAEDLAARYLRTLGLTVVARNVRTRLGEIDVVAEAPGLLVVCEVKCRRRGSFGAAADAVTPAVARRVRAATALLYGGARARRIRFDVVAVTYEPDGRTSLEHFSDAF
jgi:putative endonuclease